MRKIFIRLLCFLIMIPMAFSFAGCDFTPDDVNNIMDKYFENYKQMGNTETGEYSNFKNINVQSSYLGYGYDVINDPYMGVENIQVSNPIIDMNKIENVELLMQKVNTGNYDESYGSTMEEFYQDYATSINVYGKVGKAFSGGLKLDFSGSSEEKTYWYFYKLSYFFNSFYIHITNTVEELQDVLSAKFKSDVLNLPIDELFAKYGTHLIKEAAMGGRIEKSVTYSSTSSNDKSSMNAAVNMHIKALKSSINMEASYEQNEQLQKAGVESTTKITQLGGKAVSLSGDVDYDKWVDSFDQSLEYAALCGVVGDNSLVGLWDLVPAGHEERANAIKEKFIELSGDKYDELCKTFKLSNINDEPVDTSWELISQEMKRYNCNDGNNYNSNEIEHDENWRKRHNGWELGKLNFYGLARNGEKYVIKNQNAFSIKYNLLQNIDDLPRVGASLQTIQSDSATKVVNTSINEQIKKGAYWVRITYTDDTQKEIKATNCLDGKVQGSYINLLSASDVDSTKTIKTIEIVFVYEMYAGGPGAFGIWWKEDTNWRCEYTLKF